MEKIHVFISIPMRHKTDEEIREKIEVIKNQLIRYFKEENKIPVFVDSYDPNLKTLEPLVAISQSIHFMASADAVFFAEGWDEARGCMTEHTVAVNYGLRVIHYNDDIFLDRTYKEKYTVADFLKKCAAKTCDECQDGRICLSCQEWLLFMRWVNSDFKNFLLKYVNYNSPKSESDCDLFVKTSWVPLASLMDVLTKELNDYKL